MRGEYEMPAVSDRKAWELPPHARRIREHETLDYFKVGTTSACAENTHSFAELILSFRNYLRMRGEYHR